MIPSDHFVRYYNEVFKALLQKGPEHLLEYWRELGRLQTQELAESFKNGGIKACYEYWKRIQLEENCDATLILTDDYFEFDMRQCPSLSKVLDNDAAPCHFYCDHCMGWVEPVMKASGLHPVADMKSRTEPRCIIRVYEDKAKAGAWAAQAQLLSRPYDEPLA